MRFISKLYYLSADISLRKNTADYEMNNPMGKDDNNNNTKIHQYATHNSNNNNNNSKKSTQGRKMVPYSLAKNKRDKLKKLDEKILDIAGGTEEEKRKMLLAYTESNYGMYYLKMNPLS